MITKQQKSGLESKTKRQHFVDGIIIGIGWAIGVTLGFVLISTVLVFVLQKAGGLPFIGNFIANIVDATQDQLLKRTPIFPQ